MNIFFFPGSRLTNFVGILSQGLRIAPPEAPATGYMVLSLFFVHVSLLACMRVHASFVLFVRIYDL